MNSVKKIITAFSLSIWAGITNASLITAIDTLNPGDQYRVLFISTTVTDAVSTDISIYNAIANGDGTTGSVTSSLGLEWKALASTSTVSARSNTDTAPSSDPRWLSR